MKSKLIALILLGIGAIAFLAGSYGIYQLYDQSGEMEHTTGVVTHMKTERIYRNRKQIYKHRALPYPRQKRITQSIYLSGKRNILVVQS